MASATTKMTAAGAVSRVSKPFHLYRYRRSGKTALKRWQNAHEEDMAIGLQKPGKGCELAGQW